MKFIHPLAWLKDYHRQLWIVISYAIHTFCWWNMEMKLCGQDLGTYACTYIVESSDNDSKEI